MCDLYVHVPSSSKAAFPTLSQYVRKDVRIFSRWLISALTVCAGWILDLVCKDAHASQRHTHTHHLQSCLLNLAVDAEHEQQCAARGLPAIVVSVLLTKSDWPTLLCMTAKQHTPN